MTPLRRAVLLVALLACVTAATADARHLSMRRYDVADGLAHDQITSLLEDNHGYLWIGTFEGLSRFDGYVFTTYTTSDGLGNSLVNDLAEDARGRLWVATNGGGVSLLDDTPGAARPFTSYIPGGPGSENVNVIVFDSSGRLWCGTDAGVYVGEMSREGPVFTLAGFPENAVLAGAAKDDRVWMGVARVGFVEFRARESLIHSVPWDPSARYRRVLAHADALLVSSDDGLFRFAGDKWERVPVQLERQQLVEDLLPDGDGGLWLATNGGLLRYAAGQTSKYSLATARGGQLSTIIADAGGNLWVGLGRNGLGRIRPEQILSYTADEGLPDIDVTALHEDPFGHVLAFTRRRHFAFASREHLSMMESTAVTNRPLVPDGKGWWAIAHDGVYQIPGPVPDFTRARRLPLNVTPSIPVPSSIPLGAVDAQGRLWFATADRMLYRITAPSSPNRKVDRWPIDMPHQVAPGVFGIDAAGGVWLGSMVGLARFFEGNLAVIETPPGMANVQPRAFMRARDGGIWIGLRFGGVMMTRNPEAARPEFVRYTTADGLASDAVWALAEDQQGLVYLGTGRGLNQLDPVERTVRSFNTDDGLAGNIINDLRVDRSGAVWVASTGGISRLDLAFARVHHAPVSIYISRILLAGVTHGMPERGATRVTDLQMSSNARNVRIEFVSPSVQHQAPMRYQYMLDGIDQNWTPPRFGRSVNYAMLAPGRYRFRVRAVTTDGRTSEDPAVVDFVVQPPFWSRGWFLATLVGGMLGGVVGVQRLREQRRRSMAAIRRQVATDLHDDVGSGLSQIAILSEVAKRKAADDAHAALNQVADLARSLRESMSDIVWAVDPGEDMPVALVERMRQVTFHLLSSTSEVSFHAPDDQKLAGLDFTPDRRRQLLLIFKEAITNVARHAHATKVAIRVTVKPTRLRLTIRDNGLGFDPGKRHEGHGLGNLASRAQSIGAEIEIQSRPGEGTLIGLIVPLRRRSRIFRWLSFVEPHS